MNQLKIFLYNIWESIARWIHPNRFPEKELKPKKEKKTDKMSAKQVVENPNLCAVDLKKENEPFTIQQAYEQLADKENDEGIYFHNKEIHEVACRFGAGSSNRFQARSDKVRKKLKPLLFPNQDMPFDRTHLIPVGYHGSENDNRLLVGWDSNQNRNAMRHFESEVAKMNELESIIWITIIRKKQNGASWTTTILNTNGKELKKEKFEIFDRPFVWK